MTSRESYVFGWIYGRWAVELSEKKHITKDAKLAAMRPYSGFATMSVLIHESGLATNELEMEVAYATLEIDSIEAKYGRNGQEAVQSLENQSSWYLGYYAGYGKKPLPQQEYNVKLKRTAKGMTQSQLAEAVGTDQAMVSRWENGVRPNEESMRKLREVLGG
jgi:DNA-binding XRE family transcriptional regulator